jgi:hypothetical protein
VRRGDYIINPLIFSSSFLKQFKFFCYYILFLGRSPTVATTSNQRSAQAQAPAQVFF